MLRQSYNVDIGYIYRYLKLSVLWLHISFSPVTRVDHALCSARFTRITEQYLQLQVTIYVTDINIVTLAKHRLRAP